MNRKKFEDLVRKAILSLPLKIRRKIRNVSIVVEEGGSSKDLFGLYQGIPENIWGKNLVFHLPDKITIYKTAIEASAQGNREIEKQVRQVVRHEIAHYFGFDEEGARRLEKK